MLHTHALSSHERAKLVRDVRAEYLQVIAVEEFFHVDAIVLSAVDAGQIVALSEK